MKRGLLSRPGRVPAVLAGLGATGVSVAQEASSAIPFRTVGDSATPGAVQWLLAIGSCAVLLVLLVMLLRRWRGAWRPMRAPGRQLRIVERVAAAPHTQLVVVEYAQRRLLLSIGPAGTSCLRDDPLEPGSVAGTPAPQARPVTEIAP